ncbi:hypothetical protein GCM10009627_14230 [Curtobacterium herbarum]|uniref:Uncharacterized protein n=1 Tax=Curtobacterium herbarum TaxID=150122 RepID=A0ABN1ZBU4_9MICO
MRPSGTLAAPAAGTRAFNPIGGPPPLVETPLRVLGTTSVDTDLVVRLAFAHPGGEEPVVWVVNLSDVADDTPVREVSNGVWGMLARRQSADLLSQTVTTSTGVRLLVD